MKTQRRALSSEGLLLVATLVVTQRSQGASFSFFLLNGGTFFPQICLRILVHKIRVHHIAFSRPQQALLDNVFDIP
jgi:hypothetical protein